MKRIIIKPGREGRIRAGHPWVYDNEIAKVLEGRSAAGREAREAALLPGELADVETSRKQYLGRAFVNPHSKIRARIYSPSKEGVDKGFFKRRIREAVIRRAHDRGLSGNGPGGPSPGIHGESRRLVFAEADFLPGLIIDRFAGWPLAELEAKCAERPVTFAAAEAALGPPESWLAVQFLTYGMDERREAILDALSEVLSAPLFPEAGSAGPPPLGPPRGIVERSAARVRELEGLPPGEGLVRGDFPAAGIVIFENGLPFAVNLEQGQKTGHFLDQRENRFLAASFTGGGRVLDAFSYTGGFAVHAARLGMADKVIAVDVSVPALETLRKNAALNGVENKITMVEADVFDYLRDAERKAEKFDLVILDPPAFAKSGSALEGALRGYREINVSAIKLIKRGGCLVTCSCSQALDETSFKRVIATAAADADRRLLRIDFRSQPSDHPILLGYDESYYLKCGCYRVL